MSSIFPSDLITVVVVVTGADPDCLTVRLVTVFVICLVIEKINHF